MQFQSNLKKKEIKNIKTPIWRCGTGPSVVWTWFQQQPHQNDWRHLLGGWQYVQWWWKPWIHCWVREPAERSDPDQQGNPLRWREAVGKSDLPVDHMRKCYPYLHAQSQDGAIVEMLEDGQSESREGQGRSVDGRRDESSLVFWVVVLKVVEDFPQKQWLKHFNYLLQVRVARLKIRHFTWQSCLLENRVTKYLWIYQRKNKQPSLGVGLPITPDQNSGQAGLPQLFNGLFSFIVPKPAKKDVDDFILHSTEMGRFKSLPYKYIRQIKDNITIVKTSISFHVLKTWVS